MDSVAAIRDHRNESIVTPAHLEIQHILNEQVFRGILHLLQDAGEVEKPGRPGVLIIQQFPPARKRLTRRRHQPPLPRLLLVKLQREVLDVDAGNVEGREVVLVAGVGDAVDIESGYDVGIYFTLFQSVMLE